MNYFLSILTQLVCHITDKSRKDIALFISVDLSTREASSC